MDDDNNEQHDLGVMARRHPVPEFHGKAKLYDACLVNKYSGRLLADYKVDAKTLAVTPEPDPYTQALAEVRGHQYFWCGRPGKGSVTALPFFEGFDAEAQSHRIAFESDRALTDEGYKYYRVAAVKLGEDWENAVMTCEAGHAELTSSDAKLLIEIGLDRLYNYAAAGTEPELVYKFRLVRDPVCQRVIKAQWAANGKKASEDGTETHLQIERYYNDCLPEALLDASPEMRQFRCFDTDWVRGKKLKIFATELEMFDPYAQVFGTIDAVFVDEDADLTEYPIDVVLVDWKRTKKNDDAAFRRRGEPLGPQHFGSEPFDDWQNCTQCKRWMQLMVYAKILMDNSNGRYRVRSMHNVLFHPELDDYIVADVPPFDADRMQRAFDVARQHKVEQTRQQRAELVNDLVQWSAKLDSVSELSPQDRRLLISRIHHTSLALRDIESMVAEMLASGKQKKKKGGKRRRRAE
jgi:hypothetical protein